VPSAESHVGGAQHLGAGNRYEAGLQGSEEDRVPGGCSADEYEKPVSGNQSSGTEQRRPSVRIGRDLLERLPVDDAFAVDEGQRGP